MPEHDNLTLGGGLAPTTTSGSIEQPTLGGGLAPTTTSGSTVFGGGLAPTTSGPTETPTQVGVLTVSVPTPTSILYIDAELRQNISVGCIITGPGIQEGTEVASIHPHEGPNGPYFGIQIIVP